MASYPAIPSISRETKTFRKMQIRILPYLFLLYVIAYLDRINIGFAALTMNKELGIPVWLSRGSFLFRLLPV